MHTQATPRIAIIAYGNPLRSDDGIGWQVAELLQGESLRFGSLQAGSSDCVTDLICVHQLTPEIAEKAADADGVVFLDASHIGEPGMIRCVPVVADGNGELFSHSLSPGQMLALTEHLYGKRPDAFIVSVAGESFDHGDALSESLQCALPTLVGTVKDLAVHLARRFDPSALILQYPPGV
jgi:hydrogenase maturation protease